VNVDGPILRAFHLASAPYAASASIGYVTTEIRVKPPSPDSLPHSQHTSSVSQWAHHGDAPLIIVSLFEFGTAALLAAAFLALVRRGVRMRVLGISRSPPPA
jgi:hypothetical protein